MHCQKKQQEEEEYKFTVDWHWNHNAFQFLPVFQPSWYNVYPNQKIQ